MKKFYLLGLSVGIILALLNTFLLGIPSILFIWSPFHFAFYLTRMSGCSGESCIGIGIWIGDILFILISLLTAILWGRYRLSQNQTTQKYYKWLAIILLASIILPFICFWAARFYVSI